MIGELSAAGGEAQLRVTAEEGLEERRRYAVENFVFQKGARDWHSICERCFVFRLLTRPPFLILPLSLVTSAGLQGFGMTDVEEVAKERAAAPYVSDGPKTCFPARSPI